MIKLQERAELILQIIDQLEFATYHQLKKLHDFGTDRNMYRIIKNLSEYLHETSIWNEYVKGKVFYLNSNGRNMIGSTNEVKQSQRIVHTVLRNDVYIYHSCPNDWKNEMKIEYDVIRDNQIMGLIGSSNLKQKRFIIPDAIFKQKNIIQLIEIDHTRHMIDNQKKLVRYVEAIPQLKKLFNHTPILKIYTTTEHRKRKWKMMCEKKAIVSEVMTFSEIR